MAISDEGGSNGFYMPVAPAYAGGNGNGGFGWGGDWAWIILLLVLCGGWGNGFGGGAMFPFMAGAGMDYGLYPWLNNSQHISDGFRDQMLQTSISSIGDKITSGFGDVQTSLCSGFAGVNASVNNAQNAIAQQMYTNQIADLQSNFALQSQLASCCCDNKSSIADLKYTVATENCADRAALSDGIRDLLAATQAQTQTILTQLCNDKIEQKNDTIAQLRSELLYARGQASQDVQTAALRAGQVSEADAIYERLKNCPVGTVPVFGNQPIWTCASNVANSGFGCGCGCNG